MSEFFYPGNFVKRFAPGQVAMFESVSCMMLLNVLSSEYEAAVGRYNAYECSDSDIDLHRAINHEVYHFAQTVGSGYAYVRQQRLFSRIKDPISLSTRENSELYRAAEDLRRSAGTAESTGRERRLARFSELISDMERVSLMNSRAAPGDRSLAGAFFPDLYREAGELAAAEAESNADGLSILAVLEGTAVVHAELLLGGTMSARDRIENQLVKLPTVYRVLLDSTVQRHGDRAVELLLPAAALALRYTRPHDAYLPLLALVADSPAGDAPARARALSARLPDIRIAGPILGTAIAVHQETGQYQVYTPILRDLASGRWNVDSYSLLADPEAMRLVPRFPLGVFTRDGYIGTDDDKEFAARTVIMGIILRVQSRGWDERDFNEAAGKYLLDHLPDMLDPGSGDAVAVYRRELSECTREQDPMRWASTQHELGNALYRLGENEPGAAKLQEAIGAYRRALEEYTRERAPVEWTSTLNDLGVALHALADRGSGTARLEEAVAVFREVLKENTRQGAPLQWATTTINLGNALLALGAREAGAVRLEEAISAFRSALEECTRERAPLYWASAQNNLGSALRAIGVRESGTARLKEAVNAYREALKERSRDRLPLEWGKTQNNLGETLKQLGEREGGTARLEEAVATIREAVMELTRDRAAFDWASAQNNLGNALELMGQRGHNLQQLEFAVSAYGEALKEYTRASAPLLWAMTQNNLGLALTALGNKVANRGLDGGPWRQKAVAAFREALQERTRQRVPFDWAASQNNLGNVLANLGGSDGGTAYLEEAIAAYELALTVRSHERGSPDFAMSTGNQGVVLMLLAERRDDAHMAQTAVHQIEQSLAIWGDGDSRADFYAAMLARARAQCERLKLR